ncbi:uncharacterized protein LOC129760857 [Uranotaenia lowii]|uniref:uncharacterized protein LOC129760857 n=1 Tax=Uranotaenia lowii TaxID=190385 RepID=UPI002478F001|nr:uncharacterized protein LOC129760857 [Uranotaenia lowii]
MEEGTPLTENPLPDVVNVSLEVPVIGTETTDRLPQYVHDAIDKVAPEEGFTPGQYKVHFESGSSKGDGFVGEMFRARITEVARELIVLCKIPPRNEARRQQFGAMTIFERESTAYSKFLPAMHEFQRERGVTDELGIGFFHTPKCYFAMCDEAKQESLIIMNDLRLSGYRMWNKLVPVNYEHVRLMMIALGKLHALSFAMKDQRPDIFEEFKVKDGLVEMMNNFEPFQQMMNFNMDRATSVLEPHEEKLRQKMDRLKTDMLSDLNKLTDAATAEPYAVLGHGDCWVNNMMFAYEKGVPKDIVLLDWQICRYVSPTLDLLYFLFCCTDEQFRRQYYDEMIRTYYASLKELLGKLGGDATRQFPYTALLRQLRQFGRFGVMMAAFIVPLLCIENADLPDLDEQAERFKETQEMDMSEFQTKGNSEEKYRQRMGGVLRDAIRYGYL